MKKGHCTGNKKERQGAQDWYAAIAEAHIARIEAEEQARHALAATITDLRQVLADVEAVQGALAAYRKAQGVAQ